MKKDEYPPGSRNAVKNGCLCPEIDNNHGKGAYIDQKGYPVFWFNYDCPLHGLYGESKSVPPETILYKIKNFFKK